MLFGEFWYEHEICFLFANTNTGKSVLAVQIGDAIARGRKTGPFACEAKSAMVLYADFELSTIQFQRRYSHEKIGHDFHINFLRAEADPDGAVPDHFQSNTRYGNDELLLAGLEYRIQNLKATVLIIDNISCLSGGTGNAAGALRIMKQLRSLQAQYNLSILVLAHTPKQRNPSRHLSADDLHGSKLLINFADSAFTIGVSNRDSSLRYLKQIKQRSTHQVYGEDNVCLCRIEKPLNFLQFRFKGNGAERMHVLGQTQFQREQLAAQAAALAAAGLTQRQISLQLRIALSTVNKLLKK